VAVLVNFRGLYLGTFLACFGRDSFWKCWISKDYMVVSLVVFPCSFLVIFLHYYLSYSCIILGWFHVCSSADHYLLLYLPNGVVAYSVSHGMFILSAALFLLPC